MASGAPWPASHRRLAGPLLGGLLVTTIGWRWEFFINLLVGCACLLLTLRRVPASVRRPDRPVDWPAQCAIIATVALLIAALNEAGRRGWTSPWVLAGVGLCLLAAAASAVRERVARTPVLPLTLLRSRALGGGAAIGLLLDFAFYGMIFTASLYFQHERGLSALQTGIAVFPAVAVTMFASVVSGRLARRTGHRSLVIAGMLVGAAGLAGWAAAGPHPEYGILVGPMVAAGFGTSFALTGTTTTVMSAAPAPPPACSTPPVRSAAARGVALGGSLLASTADFTVGLRTSMAIGAAAYLIAAMTRMVLRAAEGLTVRCRQSSRDGRGLVNRPGSGRADQGRTSWPCHGRGPHNLVVPGRAGSPSR
jgi:MFS transporter, DHA2 family, methylenomycin A resistance protein